MKYILKSIEPKVLKDYKTPLEPYWNPTWADFDTKPEIKRALKVSLIEEQGFICCYCERRVSHDNSHIEHLKPRHPEDPDVSLKDDSLNYYNLLVSCTPDYKNDETKKHCGMKKGNRFNEELFVSPLSEECESRFAYSDDGRIFPTEESDLSASETISLLGLDITRLKNMRKGIIDGILDNIENLSCEEISTLVSSYESRDKSGFFQPFCTVAIYKLKENAAYKKISNIHT